MISKLFKLQFFLFIVLMNCFLQFRIPNIHKFYHMNIGSKSMDDTFQESFNMGLYPETYLYVDDQIIVVNKPANIQTAPGYISKECIANKVADIFSIPRIDHMIVHRLDYATSGVLVFARNEFTLKDLHSQFRNHRNNKIYKSYLAIVSGQMPTYEGIIDLPLSKDLTNPPLCKVDPISITSKPSITNWYIKETGKYNSLLKLKPLTGRTHQLRIHLASIGHPILGDFFYGQPHVCNEASRLLLHAEELRIIHPYTKVALSFKAPCPFLLKDFDTISSSYLYV